MKLRPDVVGDEKLKTLPKKNQNERTKKGEGWGRKEKKGKEGEKRSRICVAEDEK
jgi:hypothetical protein